MQPPQDASSFDIVPWNSNFDTEIGIIDEQHRRLVALLNELARHYVHGSALDDTVRIVNALADYTVYHFDTEEPLWREALPDDEWVAAHERAHQGFVRKIRSVQQDLAQGSPLPELDDLLSFLTRWLAHHILYEDKRMAIVLLAVRDGQQGQDAKVRAIEAMSGQTSGLIQSVLSMYELLSSRTLALERETYARLSAERALREHEANWEAMLSAGHDSLWDWDLGALAPPDLSRPDDWLKPSELLNGHGQCVHPEDWPGLRSRLLEHLLGRDEVFSHEHRVLDAQGNVRWWHAQGKVVERTAEGRPLRMIGTQTDITERRTAELTLRRERDTRLIISEFATDLLASTLGDFDAAINRALQRSGEYMRADRTYVFLLIGDGAYMNNTHEWCAPGISPEIQNLQNIPANSTPWWWQNLRERGFVLVPRVADLPPEAQEERDILEAQDIRSVCVYPLRMGGQIVGFLGNDAVAHERQWGPEVFEFLSLMSDLLSIALDHRQVLQQRAQALIRLERAEALARLGHWTYSFLSGQATWSAEMYQIFERPPTEGPADQEGFFDLLHPDDREATRQMMEHARDTLQALQLECRILLGDGRHKHVELRGQFTPGTNGQATMIDGTLQDISDKVQHRLELTRLAFEDPLTQLPNRRALEDRLRGELLRCDTQHLRLALALLDLDNFREANERHGSAVGDQLLKAISQRLQLLLADSGIVARTGGDEFVVLVSPLHPEEEPHILMRRLLECINEPMVIEGRHLSLTASIGVTEFPQVIAVTGEQLLRQAQQALFQAKLEGRNRFHVYDTASEQGSRALAERLNDIQRALQANEFVLHYQPKVHLRTGKVTGVEALIRWRTSSGQLLPPSEFLPAVQEHPLDILIGDWVIRAALSQAQTWHRQGLRWQVCVNVSGQHLLDKGFLDKLKSALDAFPELPPEALQFEILESSALQDIASVSRVMRRCLELGVSFALDDFGTGFSSLAYLKHLPANVLKIDQSFVRDMLERSDDLSIISGVVGMAQAFGLEVIAEGVETIEHGELLLRLGCEQGQGYGIARPMPPAALQEWAQHWKPACSWSDQPIAGAQDLKLLHAEVEHRRWAMEFEGWLRGQKAHAPTLDREHCPLGRWIATAERGRLAERPEFRQLRALHLEAHRLALSASDLHKRGDEQAALGLLHRLVSVRDSVIAQLQSLAR